jgi:hypothetical protein
LIKSDSGILANERVDELAKSGSKLDICDSIYNLFPLSFAKRHFRISSINEWNK